MATTKVKGTSKKIKELKGVKPEKITDEQLEKVQTLINDINRSQIELGQMETKKHAILHHISSLQEAIGVVREEFEKDYGTSDVNIQDGIINYPADVEADS
jgi:DNA/RNA endonuclease YhcR with UshA esterase domain